MKFSHYDFETEFTLSSDKVNVLVIEDEEKFYSYCSELKSQISLGEGGFCLFEDEKSLSFAKCAYVIDNYFDGHLNDKKTVGKLHQALQEEIETNFPDDCFALKQSFQIVFDKLDVIADCPIEYNDDELIGKLLKCFDVKLTENSDLLEFLLARIKTQVTFFNVKCVFFIYLKTVLSSKQLSELYHELQLEEVSAFLLENTLKEKLNGEYIVVIDRDLCEILV